jgi:hypothetical protein
VGLGEGLAPQVMLAAALFLGLGPVERKSALLLSVSVQPPLILSLAVVLLAPLDGALPSKQLALP